MTLAEKFERIKDFRPIDDVFFEALARSREFCQEILRTIMEDGELAVEDVIVQSDERNLYGRSVRLDALCTLGDGAMVNIEVQRADNDDHLKRVRFNAASITVRESHAGSTFGEIPELYVVYITESDFLGGGKTMYHVDRVLRETGETVDDGQHEIFVNTAVDDGSATAELMGCFLQKKVDNPRFPVFSSEVKRLKETEGGAESMCEIMERYTREAALAGRREERILAIQNMVEMEVPEERILLKYTREEFDEAVAAMQVRA